MTRHDTVHRQDSDTADLETSGVRSLLRLIVRRRLIIASVPVVLLALALLRSASQEPLYEGTAEVLLSRSNLAASLQGSPNTPLQPAEFFQIARTQAALAHTPTVAERVIERSKVGKLGPAELLMNSEVRPDRNTDLLTFLVRDPNRADSQRLAGTFAREYTAYRRELDTGSIERARQGLEETLQGLNRSNADDRKVFESLTAKEQQLRIMAALQSANAAVVRTSSEPVQVRPSPFRDGIVAVFLGLILGGALALLRDTLDTRVRTPEEIGEALGLSPLGFVPPPPKNVRAANGLVMRDAPNTPQAEAFRILATSLQLQNLDARAKVIMITSAVEEEGKSTTISNLALTLARSGRRIALVDLDLRRPRLHELFGVGALVGITDIALGTATLAEARVPIEIPIQESAAGAAPDSDVRRKPELDLFVAGRRPTDPAEFVNSRAITRLLAELREDYDFVLVDCSPLLRVSDPLVLSARVDAMFIVTRLGVVRRPMLREMRRIINTAQVRVFGFVASGEFGRVGSMGYGYGYGYGYYGPDADDTDDVAGTPVAAGGNGSGEHPLAAPKR